MNRNYLKLVSILLPVLFFIGLIMIRSSLVQFRSIFSAETVVVILALGGSILFSQWVFRAIEKNEIEIKHQSKQLAALHEAALSLTRELDLNLVLQKVVDHARELSKAKYGALGVLESDGRWIDQFIFSGISHNFHGQMGVPPKGHGMLGAVIEDGHPIRVSNIGADPRSSGFPSIHPSMQSFLGVPIRFKDEVIGELYLTDKLGDSGNIVDFSEQDQSLLEMFATQAAIAIKNAQLYRQSQQLTIFQERERFGMDLHDGIIQSIYAIGLMLDDTLHRLSETPDSAAEGITQAISGLNEVIRDIRNYILDLRPNRFQGRDLKEGLGELARELRANSFLDVNLSLSETDISMLNPEKTVDILHIVQEAFSNIRKHARASYVDVHLDTFKGYLNLMIKDDGIGLNSEHIHKSTGNGLRNMQERAQLLGGIFEVITPGERGTQIQIKIPFDIE